MKEGKEGIFLPPEIVWKIMIHSQLKDLPHLFTVCRRWGEISLNQNFWVEYKENSMKVPIPNFEPGSLEDRVAKFVDQNDLSSLKKVDLKDLKKLKKIDFEAEWLDEDFKKVGLNFLMYACSKNKFAIVKYFVSENIYPFSDVSFGDNDSRCKVDVWTVCTAFGRTKILDYLLSTEKDTSRVFESSMIGESFFKKKMGDFSASLYCNVKNIYWGRKKNVPFPLLVFPIIWGDIEMIRLLLQNMSKEEIWEKSQCIIVGCSNLHQEKLARVILDEFSSYAFVGFWGVRSCLNIQKEIEVANERICKLWGSRSSGCCSFLVGVKTLSGVVHYVKCHPLDNVETLKKRVEERVGIPPSSQRMVYFGKIIDDQKTLKECGIGYKSHVQLVVQL